MSTRTMTIDDDRAAAILACVLRTNSAGVIRLCKRINIEPAELFRQSFSSGDVVKETPIEDHHDYTTQNLHL